MAHYNIWANAQFIRILRSLEDEKLDMEIVSSFPGIRKTVLHIWGAEDIWMQRLMQVPKVEWKALSFNDTIGALCDNWEETSGAYPDYINSKSDPEDFGASIPVTNIKGEKYNDQIAAILQHVFNHSSYHRGQLVTMLRQAGITTIPSTDLIAYVRATGI